MKKSVLPYANNIDQPARIRCLDIIISLVSISEISSLKFLYGSVYVPK